MNQVEEAKQKAPRRVTILRALADWLEQHPGADLHVVSARDRCYSKLWAPTKEELAEQVRALGTVTKRPCPYNDNDYEFVVDVTEDYQIIFYTEREKVCKRIVVGKRQVPQEIVPGRIVEAHEEDIVEWECGESILAHTGSEEEDLPEVETPSDPDPDEHETSTPEYNPEEDPDRVTPGMERQIREWAESMKEYKD